MANFEGNTVNFKGNILREGINASERRVLIKLWLEELGIVEELLKIIGDKNNAKDVEGVKEGVRKRESFLESCLKGEKVRGSEIYDWQIRQNIEKEINEFFQKIIGVVKKEKIKIPEDIMRVLRYISGQKGSKIGNTIGIY